MKTADCEHTDPRPAEIRKRFSKLSLAYKLIKYSAAPPSHHLLKPLPESHLGAHILGA